MGEPYRDDDFGDEHGDDSVEDPIDSIALRTPFPMLMTLTGVLWILAGFAWCALFTLSRALGLPFNASELWLLLGAFFFLKDGVQLLRGTFRDPLSDGILTLLIGLFFLGRCYLLATGNGQIGSIVVCGFFGLVFFVPGVLVLIARKQYLAWKAEQER